MKKATGTVDKEIGTRMRSRRMIIGMSQEKLGEMLGLTFQQVQKYEKGTNRISVSRHDRYRQGARRRHPLLLRRARGREAAPASPSRRSPLSCRISSRPRTATSS